MEKMDKKYIRALMLAALLGLAEVAYSAVTQTTAPAPEEPMPAAVQSKPAADAATQPAEDSQPQTSHQEQSTSPDAQATAGDQPKPNGDVSSGTGSQTPPAATADDTDGVRAAIKDLLDTLVEQGVLKQDKADAVMRKAEERLGAGQQPKRPPPPADPNVVGVPYVPAFVKDEIRDQVRNGLRKDVLKDVLTQAKEERWGLPGVLPRWVDRIHWSGDLRLRAQADMFDSGNAKLTYFNFQNINQAGTFNAENGYLNTTTDRYRLRLRARLAMDAAVTDNLKAGMRITTGNTTDPVSTNQTLGNYGGRYQVVWDEAYLRYRRDTAAGSPWLTLWGGRMPNPWMHTDLVWDSDLAFEGLAGTLHYSLEGPAGAESGLSRGVFLTAGAFPLQEVELSSRDKWLYGAQVGGEWQLHNESIFKLGVAYYDYSHITGEPNVAGSHLLDFTAPPTMQKGNTVFDISDPNNSSSRLYALAADYNLINATASFDFAQLAPTHVILTADYVKNIGYNTGKVQQLFDSIGANGQQAKARTIGYQFEIAVGHPHIRRYRDWRITGAFKHLERDAVLDAFTDSDFHLGGTDAEGWTLQGDYGLMEDTWLTVRWLSSNAIDGPPLSVDILQVDFNTRF